MPPSRRKTYSKIALALLAAWGLCVPRAWAFELTETRWTNTATPGDGTAQGSPAIVTWSIVPDGTPIPGTPWIYPTESSAGSSLRQFFDGIYGSAPGPVSNRPWFFLFDDAATRWSELSGLSMVYEPIDDGAAMYTTATMSVLPGAPGQLGARGDIRIGGHPIDGQSGDNIIGYSMTPNASEMVLDTDNFNYFFSMSNNSRQARNAIMHELGHGLGLLHSESSDAQFLLEPNILNTYDGPQLDDILGLHRWYGDAYEKSNNLAGNNSLANATPLGSLQPGQSFALGTDAIDTVVEATDIDFVSIDDDSDEDFYSFTIDAPGEVSLSLIPRGPTYMVGPGHGPQSSYDSSAQSNLTLELRGTDGATPIAIAESGGLGAAESLAGMRLEDAGTYYVRITGDANTVQLYELQIAMEPEGFLPGDVNLDGMLEFGTGLPTDDLLAFINGWKTVLPTDDDEAAWMKGDLDLNRVSDLRDAFLMRQAIIDAGAPASLAWLSRLGQPSHVPEPSAGALLIAIGTVVVACRGHAA